MQAMPHHQAGEIRPPGAVIVEAGEERVGLDRDLVVQGVPQQPVGVHPEIHGGGLGLGLRLRQPAVPAFLLVPVEAPPRRRRQGPGAGPRPLPLLPELFLGLQRRRPDGAGGEGGLRPRQARELLLAAQGRAVNRVAVHGAQREEDPLPAERLGAGQVYDGVRRVPHGPEQETHLRGADHKGKSVIMAASSLEIGEWNINNSSRAAKSAQIKSPDEPG